MLYTLTEFLSGPRVITKNKAIWRVSRHMIVTVGESELACLAASPSRLCTVDSQALAHALLALGPAAASNSTDVGRAGLAN